MLKEAIFKEKRLISRGNETRGMYAHPLLVPHIASWANARFAIIVSEIVNDCLSWTYQWYIRHQDSIIKGKDFEIQQKDVDLQIKDYEIQDVNATLENVRHKVVPDTLDPSKRMIFALFRVDSSSTEYWAIRCQEVNFPKQVKSARTKLGEITLIFKIVDPNSFNLFIRIKEHGKDLFEWKRNLITLKDMSYKMNLIALVDNLVNNRI